MNELPYLPPDFVLQAARDGVDELNRYADHVELDGLKGLLARYSGVPETHIVLSPGSDILLRELILSFSRDRKLVMLSPSFLPTVEAARQFAGKIVNLRLTPPDFELKPQMLLEELDEPCLLVVENPNNPTGRLVLDQKTLAFVLSQPDTLCVIDEAYFEFSGLTFADMVPDHPNLAVTRTLDKSFSLAGARVGYLLAGAYFLDAFSSFYAFLPRPSLKAAMAALRRPDYKDEHIRSIVAERERLRRQLADLHFTVCESQTNFLLLQTNIPDAPQRLKERGVLVADVSSQLAPGYIRISVGTRDENDALVKALSLRDSP
jgi:histidinol-phosphate aminotransferase